MVQFWSRCSTSFLKSGTVHKMNNYFVKNRKYTEDGHNVGGGMQETITLVLHFHHLFYSFWLYCYRRQVYYIIRNAVLQSSKISVLCIMSVEENCKI